MTPLRVVVLGGTGRTGRRIAEEALAQGHDVAVLGRSATADTVPAGVLPIRADVLDPDALGPAVAEADAVVVSLSIPRASASPWAAVTGPADLHSRSARMLIELLAPGQRLVKLSAQGVGDSAPRTGWAFRALVAASNVGRAFADHAVADELVARSSTRWTLVRPPRLSDAEDDGPVEVGEALATSSFESLSRRRLARFVVGALVDPSLERRIVTVRAR